MNIIKDFMSNNLHTNIVIKGTNLEPLFRANDIAIILEISNIHSSISKFNKTEKDVLCTTDSIGRTQQVTFLTEKGLYKLLFRARNNPIAEEFQNWICEVIKEIRLTGQYKLEKEISELREQIVDEIQDKSNKLIRAYNNDKVVYLIKFNDTVNNLFIIKIGWSKSISERIVDIKREYQVDNLYILDIFRHNNSDTLEKMILANDFIKSKHFEYIQKNGTKSREVFQVNMDEYNQIIQIINDLIPSVQKELSYEQQVQLKELDLELAKINLETLKISQNIKLNKDEVLEEEKEVEKEDEELLLIRKIKEVPEKMIAMLNYQKTKIENLFVTSKDASVYFNGKTGCHISQSLKNGTCCKNKYWSYFENCSDELKREYIINNSNIPEPKKIHNAMGILKIDIKSGKILIRYPSASQVEISEGISRKTLLRYIEKNKPINNFRWKIA